MSLDAVLQFFTEFDSDSYAVFACQGAEPTEEDVQAFETTVGFRLPDDFREFTKSPLGGLYMEVLEELWPRPEDLEQNPDWMFFFGVQVFGISQDIPEWLDIREQYREFVDAGYGGLVPFLQVIGDANCYCFREDGKIVYWDFDDPEAFEVVDMAFPELLMHEILALEERKSRMLASHRDAEDSSNDGEPS